MIFLQIFVFLTVGLLYYYGTDQSIKRRTFTGDYLNCEHGTLSIHHSPKCSCDNEWNGIACDMCEGKGSCSGDQICDTSLLVLLNQKT